MSQTKAKILLVDDDSQALDSTCKILKIAGYSVTIAHDGQEALDLVRAVNGKMEISFDMVVTDVRMPKINGIELLRTLSISGKKIPVVLMTAYGRIDEAVWAMKLGAVDFLMKPFKRQTLLAAVEMALKRSFKIENNLVMSGDQLIGVSTVINDLKILIKRVAPTDSTVLLNGESGTGKELVARSIHQLSKRNSSPFIAINCAAIPEQLLESELFGYEKGAFSGAINIKPGLFETANHGTLLLDEIGDMPMSLQPKLLRLLQEGEVRRLGSNVPKRVNVRLIASTHKDLHEAVKKGDFRQDLLFRLEVVGICIPALRERMEDLPELAYWFLRKNLERQGVEEKKKLIGISEEAMEILLAHTWPGNVRELSNVIERAVVFATTEQILPEDLPPHLLSLQENLKSSGKAIRSAAFSVPIAVPLGVSLKEVEELLIQKTMEATGGDKTLTARLLGINLRTVYRKIGKRHVQEESQ